MNIPSLFYGGCNLSCNFFPPLTCAVTELRLLQVVHSRALAVPGPDGVVVPMLVPMVDMFNHGQHAGHVPDVDSGADHSSSLVEQEASGPSENVRCAHKAPMTHARPTVCEQR